MNGILLIDKPSGWTSFDVVAKVRGLLRQAAKSQPSSIFHLPSSPSTKLKVGHTGTLDPLATGLMVVVVGDYCKRADEFTKLDKTYEVTLKLGQTSTTGDEEGEKTTISTHKPVEADVRKACEQFLGDIEQTPPIFSAIKVNGQRAYDLARAGKEVVMQPRQVKIYEIKDIKYAYPEVNFTTKVSSGTYIRSLAQDIGEVLETGAYMSALRRTSVGHWSIENALEMDGLNSEIMQNNLLGVETV